MLKWARVPNANQLTVSLQLQHNLWNNLKPLTFEQFGNTVNSSFVDKINNPANLEIEFIFYLN